MEKIVYLTFDDTVANQRTFVAPLLHQLGWNATFFISFFSDEWQAQHHATQMTVEQLQELSKQGFELGNHTWNHCLPDEPKALLDQVMRIEDFFARHGLPRATSFAYPGGPYHAAMAALLKTRGYHCARCVEHRPLEPGKEDLFRLPAYAIHDDHPETFEAALAALSPEHPIVLCYHGVPDRVHPWVNTEPEHFRTQMLRLQQAGASGKAIKQL